MRSHTFAAFAKARDVFGVENFKNFGKHIPVAREKSVLIKPVRRVVATPLEMSIAKMD